MHNTFAQSIQKAFRSNEIEHVLNTIQRSPLTGMHDDLMRCNIVADVSAENIRFRCSSLSIIFKNRNQNERISQQGFNETETKNGEFFSEFFSFSSKRKTFYRIYKCHSKALIRFEVIWM